MRIIKFILLSFFLLFFTACSNRSVLYSDRGLAPSQHKRALRDNTFYVNLETLSGNMVYIDRKYFKQAFDDTLGLHKAKREFKSNAANLNVYIYQTKLDENRFEGDYKDVSQYRIDRKLKIKVTYSVYGEKSYNNSFTYNVLVKSGSYLSYDDADRKAHIKLFRQLGKMVAQRVLKLRRRYVKRR